MKPFEQYLSGLSIDKKEALTALIQTVISIEPTATEGLNYGLPGFTYNNRPLIGFSANKHGLNLYPYNPEIISQLKPELEDFEVTSGTIRFSPDNQIPEHVIALILELRIALINR